MSASVRAYWKGMTNDQSQAQPQFGNDSIAWASWMAERENHPDVLKTISDAGAGALLVRKTQGMWWFQVKWATPRELAEAARRLRAFIESKEPGAKKILATYATHGGVRNSEEEFIRDLYDIERIAAYAESEFAQKMTLEVVQ